MERNKKRLVTLEEANERFSSMSEEAREIQELSDKINELMDSFVKERNSKRISQRDLAELLDWKQPALARMERLEVIPRLDTFLKAVMKIGGNIFIEYYDNNVPKECIKSATYQSYVDTGYQYDNVYVANKYNLGGELYHGSKA